MPGSQLVNRLQDINYRVQVVSDPAQLASVAQTEKPLLVFADLDGNANVCAAIASLRQNQATAHIPIVAFTDHAADERMKAARQAGATLVVTDAALAHLPQLLERALQVE
jgi:CheY-like chemotaxis protein